MSIGVSRKEYQTGKLCFANPDGYSGIKPDAKL